MKMKMVINGKKILVTSFCLFFIFFNKIHAQTKYFTLETGKTLYDKSDILSYKVTDSLIILDYTFLGKNIDTNETIFFAPNNIIPGRNYTSADGIFIRQENLVFINYRFSVFGSNTLENNIILINFFIDEKVYQLVFAGNNLISMSKFWKSYLGWNETHYFSKNITDYPLNEFNLNPKDAAVLLDSIINENFILGSIGKRSDEEVYKKIFN